MRDDVLINYVKAHEFIFNKKHPDYKNVQKKEAAWKEIGSILRCPPRACLVRWVSLRDRFTRELRIRKMEQANGTAVEARTQWRLMESLSFLEPCVHHRKHWYEEANHEDGHQDQKHLQLNDHDLLRSYADPENTNILTSAPTTSYISSNKIDIVPEVQDQLKQLSDSLEPTKELEKDCDYTLALSVYSALKSLKNPRLKFEFRKSIRGIVNDIEESALSNV